MIARVSLVVAVVAALLLTGQVAHAGGPTSAILVSPQTGRTASVYHSSTAYERLDTLLGGESPTGGPPPASLRFYAYVTVTWLVHDVSVWRLDRIFLDGVGAPWVVTERRGDTSELLDGWGPGEEGGPAAMWHRPTDPAALHALLAELGVIGPVAARSDVAPPPVVAEQASSPWWWAAGGALVAVLGGWAAGSLRRRRSPEPDGPAIVVQG